MNKNDFHMWVNWIENENLLDGWMAELEIWMDCMRHAWGVWNNICRKRNVYTLHNLVSKCTYGEWNVWISGQVSVSGWKWSQQTKWGEAAKSVRRYHRETSQPDRNHTSNSTASAHHTHKERERHTDDDDDDDNETSVDRGEVKQSSPHSNNKWICILYVSKMLCWAVSD